MYPFIHIAGREIGSYGVCAFAGLAAAAICLYLLRKRHGLAFEDIILLLLSAAGGMIFGGSLLYGLTNAGNLINLLKNTTDFSFSDFVKGLMTVFGGMVFYGGFLGAILTLKILSPKVIKGKSFGEVLDLYAITVPLFHTFGRLGCFLGGCCYGIESRFGFVVNGNTLSPEINGVRRFPVSLLEALLNLLIFFLLLELYRSGRCRQRLIFVYMFVYPPIRFGLEFLRGDDIRGYFLGLSTSQWISLVLVLFALVNVLLTRFVKKNMKNLKETEIENNVEEPLN